MNHQDLTPQQGAPPDLNALTCPPPWQAQLPVPQLSEFQNPSLPVMQPPARPPLRDKPLAWTKQQVDSWIEHNQHSRPEVAALFKRHLSSRPTSQWLGDWSGDVRQAAKQIASHAKWRNALFQIVLYNIPNRDVGSFSAGGLESRHAYLNWIRNIAAGIGSAEGIIIIEPDALAHAVELDPTPREQRLNLLAETVKILRYRCKHAYIYIDAGHPGWLGVDVVTALLLRAGVKLADGIALNVSNSHRTDDCYRYGLQIVQKLGISERHGFVIDTSRNGAGPPPPHVKGVNRWANVPTSRIGEWPTTRLPHGFSQRLHALLWVKTPGESDGNYNGAPPAGVFWPEGALKLIGEGA